MKNLQRKNKQNNISKNTKYLAYVNSVYAEDVDSYSHNYDQGDEVEERGFYKNTYYSDKIVNMDNWKVSSVVPKQDVKPFLETMHTIYKGYSKDKNLKIYMDGQFAIRDIWIKPDFWQECNDDSCGTQQIIIKFIEAYESAMKEIWSQYLYQTTELANKNERIINPLFEGLTKLIGNHFDIMDFVRDLEKLNDGNFNLDIEGQKELEQKYHLVENYNPLENTD